MGLHPLTFSLLPAQSDPRDLLLPKRTRHYAGIRGLRVRTNCGGKPLQFFFTQPLPVIFAGRMIMLYIMSGAKVVALLAVAGVGGAILPVQVDQAFRIEDNILHFLQSFLLHNNMEVAILSELVDAVGVEVAMGVEEEVDWEKGQTPLVMYKHLLK